MSQFHNFWLDQVKNKSGASFVAWELEKGITKLKLIINGETKYISLTGGFEGVTIETYAHLIKELEQ